MDTGTCWGTSELSQIYLYRAYYEMWAQCALCTIDTVKYNRKWIHVSICMNGNYSSPDPTSTLTHPPTQSHSGTELNRPQRTCRIKTCFEDTVTLHLHSSDQQADPTWPRRSESFSPLCLFWARPDSLSSRDRLSDAVILPHCEEPAVCVCKDMYYASLYNIGQV